MATITPKRKTTKEKCLSGVHVRGRQRLERTHQEGDLCDWCGRPMYLHDPTKNWDYKEGSTNPLNGILHADHSKMSRSECLRRGLPVPPPDRFLHQTCNIQRGDGGNDHLAWINTGKSPMLDMPAVSNEALAMPWPWVA